LESCVAWWRKTGHSVTVDEVTDILNAKPDYLIISSGFCPHGSIPMIYDIIGDIHGHADKLEGLLIKLDYEMKDGFYQHNNRKVVFVGDFIDRGTQNRRVVEVV
jgi:hypothetical protein